MKALLKSILLISIFYLNSCVVNKVTSVEFVEKDFKEIVIGENHKLDQSLVATCFNKYFNEAKFGSDFNRVYNLDTINYSKFMLIEIFLEPSETEKKVQITRLAENKDFINVYFSISEIENSEKEKIKSAPFTIIMTPKSKKTIKYIEDGKGLEIESKKVYIK